MENNAVTSSTGNKVKVARKPVNTPKARKSKKSSFVLIALVIILCVLIGYLVYGSFNSLINNVDMSSVTSSKATTFGTNIVAVVNGQEISRQEIVLYSQNRPGESFESLLNEYINVALLAQHVNQDKSLITPDSEALKNFGTNMALSQYALANKKQLHEPVPEEKIKTHYKTLVSDSTQYTQYQVLYTLSKNLDDAKSHITQLSKDKTNATKVFKLFNMSTKKSNEEMAIEWLYANQLPYQFSSIVQRLGKGGYTTQPLPTRDGFFVLWVKDVRDGKKPTLDESKSLIETVVVKERIAEFVQGIREQSDIRIR